ncbi:hypothetical protein Poli38472_010238 [Pythium oligandrum]|uniref:Cytochrome b5 heme-binding domain-containing protein n=1 Tax=Pythium oligandrum TaxID=41045 RepID=A0A8K1FF64_PYTOL|nr:hypothetical protein Poli38472_010238 [Pythium oligandrum]|eukprot:TMW58679.1 hypothetical protein Poli38472_010238 [Pythium oligandrum]
MAKSSVALMALALVVAVLAFAWPSIEQQLIAQGVGCPWPFNALLHNVHKPANHGAAQPVTPGISPLKAYTLEELKKYDGTDKDLPILLAIGGKVVDVTSGAKFYGVGKTYSQFAGTACTRALGLSSLEKKDINDDVSDFTETQLRELEETKLFYYEKYPVVGQLVN